MNLDEAERRARDVSTKRVGWRWKRKCPKESQYGPLQGIHNSVSIYETIGGMAVSVGERCLRCKDVTQTPRYREQSYIIEE